MCTRIRMGENAAMRQSEVEKSLHLLDDYCVQRNIHTLGSPADFPELIPFLPFLYTQNSHMVSFSFPDGRWPFPAGCVESRERVLSFPMLESIKVLGQIYVKGVDPREA